MHSFSIPAIDELLALLPALRDRDVISLTAADFDIAPLRAEAARWRREIEDGAGFVLLRGLPVEQLTIEESTKLYWGLGCLLGLPVAQKARGDLLYAVRDEGYNIAKDYGTVGVRFSKTTEAVNFHTDSALEVRGNIPDVVGLFAWQVAKSGGTSALVKACTAYETIERERPDLLQRLCQPFAVDRRVELLPEERPVLEAPVFTRNGKVSVRYFRYYIERAPELTGVPLDERTIEALNYLDNVCQRPESQIRFDMERGDIQFVHNKLMLHSRTKFEDFEAPERRRHLVRLWLVWG